MDADLIQILLIEDDRGDVFLLKESLAEATSIRTKLTHADHLSDGLERIATQAFDVILLDLNLPDSFGLETLLNLQRQVHNIPIVVLSGLADDYTTIEAVRHGAQDFLVKGEISGPLLGRVLRYAIERKQADQQVRAQAARLKILADASQAFAKMGQDYQALLDHVVHLVAAVLADTCYIRLLSDDGKRLDLGALHMNDPEVLQTWGTVLAQETLSADDLGLVSQVFRTGQLAFSQVLQPEQLKDSIPPKFWPFLERFAPHSMIVVPLSAQGRRIGVLVVIRHLSDRPSFTDDDVILTQDLASRAALAINSARLFMQVQSELAERKQAEDALRENEERYRIIFGLTNDYAYKNRIEPDGQVVPEWMTEGVTRITGYTLADAQTPDFFVKLVYPADIPILIQHTQQVLSGQIDSAEARIITKSGELRWLLNSAYPISDAAQGRVVAMYGTAQDITERKRAEQALHESEQRYRQIIETAQEGIWAIDADNRTTLINQRLADMLGYTREEILGKTIYDFTDEEGKAIGAKSLENRRLGINEQLDFKFIRKDSAIVWAILETSTLYDQTDQYAGAFAMLTDITQRKQTEEKIRQQLARLTALSEIDRAISTNFDLQLSLDTVLVHVIAQLDVDAADVLLYDSATQMLEYAAGQGFRTQSIAKSPIALSKGHVARAVLNRRTVYIPDLTKQPDDSIRSALFENEGFISYYAVPLFAKGQLNGVLGIFHRSHLQPDEEWLGFLNTLARQCAIAIDNATLFSGLQRSNIELGLAYDATIEGWSRALDLRDKETEGHSRRVTDMSLRLARSMSMSHEELLQVRRGALLHDIGKMGVPDAILLKPGKLTDEEWIIMRKHPEFAYSLLSPIAYLKPALDIPYCHHEKWDGTGYPRGLKGEEIPLAARLFAVVDVWDALRSDRPYRAAWSAEKVREHIQSLAGTHFAPAIVKAFLMLGL